MNYAEVLIAKNALSTSSTGLTRLWNNEFISGLWKNTHTQMHTQLHNRAL